MGRRVIGVSPSPADYEVWESVESSPSRVRAESGPKINSVHFQSHTTFPIQLSFKDNCAKFILANFGTPQDNDIPKYWQRGLCPVTRIDPRPCH